MPNPYHGSNSIMPLTDHEVRALLLSLNRARFVVFDFETTGLDKNNDRIVEVGAIAFSLKRCNNKWGVDEQAIYETLINPGMSVPASATNVHGLDDLSLSSAPSFEQAAKDFLPFIKDSILIAHNAAFDYGFLVHSAYRNKMPVPENPIYDTIAIAKKTVPSLPSYSLKSLADSFGIEQKSAHRGGDDARVCMEIFIHCVNLLDVYGISDY